VVFDIGAHAGFYSLLASELTGCKGRVYAFEPLPRNVRCLREHLRINHIANVYVVEAAVADFDGRAMFLKHSDSTMGRVSAEGSLEVRTVTLDQLVSDGGIPSPQFLKIDVEGGETAVLSGARQLLARTHPAIFLSTHGQDLHRKCSGFLISLGYSLRAIDKKDVKESDELLAVF
jgi:FkbM family methyltransferase